MSRSEIRRTRLIAVRLTPDEYDTILADATAAGMSMSKFVRSAVAAEVVILRQQRAIREEQLRLWLLPNGTTVGNVAMTPIEVRYVD